MTLPGVLTVKFPVTDFAGPQPAGTPVLALVGNDPPDELGGVDVGEVVLGEGEVVLDGDGVVVAGWLLGDVVPADCVGWVLPGTNWTSTQ